MSPMARFRDKDTLSGAIFFGTGLVFLSQSVALSFGTTRSMGPGFLPVILSGLLCLFGGVVMLRGFKRAAAPATGIPPRGLAAVVSALLIFASCVRGAGVAPTVMAVVLTAALGSQKSRLIPSLLLAISLAVFSCVTFVWALGLPLSIIGPWLGGY